MRLRNRTKTSLLLAASAVTLTVAFPAHAADTPIYRQPTAPREQRIKDLLRRMTIEEKARQLDMYRGSEVIDKPDGTHATQGAHVGAVTDKNLGKLGAGSIHDLYPDATLYNEIQRWVIAHNRLGIPALFIEEGLHGFSNSYQGGTVYPQSINLATTWDTNLAKATSAEIAAEARPSGIGMLLGPVLDVAREPRWGRVEEDFGEDPYLTGELGAAYVQGMQGDSLDTDHTAIAEPKHFVGHGSPEGGLNTAPVHAGEREINSVFLRSFEPAIRRSHAMGIMAAYHEIDGIPCTDNPWLLTTLLRDQWGFQGFVLSDLGAIQMLYDTHHTAATPSEAIRQALTAGVDMQFYDFDHDTFQTAIVQGVKQGKLPVSVVDRAVARVLRVKFALGLFDHPYVDPAIAPKAMRNINHLSTSRQSSMESMCLLKNEGKALPLSKLMKRVAVIGPNAATVQLGDYAAPGKDAHPISLLEGVQKVVSSVTEVVYDDGKDIDAVVAKVKGADAVILALGEHQGISGESFDRSTLDLPGNQEALMEAVAATGVPTVLVLQNGRPLSIPWAAAHIPAILEAWYPGEYGGQAIAATLFGDNNPSGRLPISFPRSVGALPDYYNHDRSKSRGYIDGSPEPLFPFGHGLSYTSFRYENLTATPSAPGKPLDVTVSVDVTNTGPRTGAEVVQLYLHPATSSVETPERALKGFTRIASLRTGETRRVTFHLRPYELEIWNTQKQWVVENGNYTVFVGGSSRADLSTPFSLKPVVAPASNGVISLEAADAALHGSNIRRAEEHGIDFIGYWDKSTDYPSWTVRIPTAKTYRVVAEYSTGDGTGPTVFDVSVADTHLSSGSVQTKGWADYKSASLGTVHLSKSGIYTLTVRPHDPAHWGPMNIKAIRLIPADVRVQ